MKYVFIVNPISGCGKGLSAGKAIEEYCRELRLDYKIYYTLKSGDATRFASLHRDKNTIIYSVGGDVTLTEIVNGIAKSDAMLSVVPVGSGNDFYKSLQGEDYNAIDLCNVDGEIIKDTHFSFSLQKQGLKIRQNEELGINKMLYLKKILKLGTSD